MKSGSACILVLNGGSSSIRFALYEAGGELTSLLSGKIDRIGISGTTFTVSDRPEPVGVDAATVSGYRSSAQFLLSWLRERALFDSVKAVGHRVVHGKNRSEPALVTENLLTELKSVAVLDPEHIPLEIALIETFMDWNPAIPQIACFDTAFHSTIPTVARLMAIPRRYATKGVVRYGFHGISFSYLVEELIRIAPDESMGRIILAHLGNGASMAAVHEGKSIDTSMGFTPASGLVMGSRSGDLDPGLAYYLWREEGMTAAQFQHMANHESGLLGLSETSSDMRDLLAKEAQDERSSEAVQLFCYRAKKWIGSFAAALGGLDVLVFAGGIGENAPRVRARICDGLGFLGIELEEARNAVTAGVISKDSGRVSVRVIHTDEELMIARSVMRIFPAVSSVALHRREPVAVVVK